MIITAVEALHLRQEAPIDTGIADGSQDALIVRIHTDAGIVGIGEVDSFPPVVKAVIEGPASHVNASGLGGLLVGENPLEIERLREKMYAGSIYYGRRGPAIHAISGLEIALWDIYGKSVDQPIHRLLGGARRDRVRAYASTLMPDTPEETRRVVEEHLGAGFTAIKLGWGPLGREADADVALVAAAREAAGEKPAVIIDVGLGWTSVREAIDSARRWEEYRPEWIEEPFGPDEYAKYRRFAEAIDTPVSGGENEATVLDFERLIEDGGVEIVQPDVTRAGGISECLRIAELARSTGRRCVLHAWSTGIIKAATLHVLAAMPEAEWFECCVQETAMNRRLVAERFDPDSEGFVAIPDGPGLGVELDEDVLAEVTVAA